MSKQSNQDKYPKYYLIVDDTGHGNGEKYHVGYLTSKIKQEDLDMLNKQFQGNKDKCLKKIKEAVVLMNKVLEKLDSPLNLEGKRLEEIDEIHAMVITNHIKCFKSSLEHKKIIPTSNVEIADLIRNDPDFQKLVKISMGNDKEEIERYTSGDSDQMIENLLTVTKSYIGDTFFEYAEQVSKIIKDNDLKVVVSEYPPIDNKTLLENSQLELPYKNITKTREILSFQDLIMKTMNFIGENDQNPQLFVQILCDNGIRKDTTNLVLLNHKEFEPFRIKKVTGSFMDSHGNPLIESADVIAWMNNRFESLLVNLINNKSELKYLDKKVFEIFKKNILPQFIDSDFDKLAKLLQEMGVKRSIAEKSNRKFVEKFIYSSLGE